MAEDLQRRHPQDLERINVFETWHLRYWCEELGVSPEQLKEAVQKVGVMVQDVKRYFGK